MVEESLSLRGVMLPPRIFYEKKKDKHEIYFKGFWRTGQQGER